MNMYTGSISEVVEHFKTSLSAGLCLSEIGMRLERYGPNRLPEQAPTSVLQVLMRQFLSPLMFVLVFAAIASLIIRDIDDALVIFLAVIINVIVGFFQEWKAEKAAQALRRFETPSCYVIRDGQESEIAVSDLVPGDIVLLLEGSRVPADVRLAEAYDLSIEEALLTGESEPVQKTTEALKGDCALGDRTNMAFLGTYIIQGKGKGIVVATGKNTELGGIAQLLAPHHNVLTPVQVQLKRFSWILAAIMLFVALVIFIFGLVQGFELFELVKTSIALAVAAIPEGLLIGVTVILAVGMQRIFKHKALIKKLIAAETLGSVSIICSDKTGTLTQGRLAVSRIITKKHDVIFDGRLPDDAYDLLCLASLNNNASIGKDGKGRIGDPTEVALLESAVKENIDIASLQKNSPRRAEISFTSDRKYMVTVHKYERGERLIMKGAPEVVFEYCDIENADKKHFLGHVHEMTNEGLRVLAFAYKDRAAISLKEDIHGLWYAGIIGLQDPLRPTAEKTVKKLQEAGIRVVIITGDHPQTALHIARGAGITGEKGRLLLGSDIAAMTFAELREQVCDVDVFARVDPKQKLDIVRAFQERNDSVAMVGDGVNDAPAIRKADIGIALGEGSDLSSQVADMVLLDNNLATVAAAVHEGRVIFENIRKVIVYLLADSFSEMILIGGAIAFGLPLPITAVQILWINLVSDGFPNIALTLEPGERGIMSDPPRAKNEPILTTEMKIIIFIIGLITDIGLFGLYVLLRHMNFELGHLRTIIFTALSLDSLLFVFSVRTMRSSLFRTNPFGNIWMLPAIGVGLAVQLLAVYVPTLQGLFDTVALDLYEWGYILGLSLVKIIAIEIAKEIFILSGKKRLTQMRN